MYNSLGSPTRSAYAPPTTTIDGPLSATAGLYERTLGCIGELREVTGLVRELANRAFGSEPESNGTGPCAPSTPGTLNALHDGLNDLGNAIVDLRCQVNRLQSL